MAQTSHSHSERIGRANIGRTHGPAGRPLAIPPARIGNAQGCAKGPRGIAANADWRRRR